MKMSFRVSILVASLGVGLGAISCDENNPQQKNAPSALDSPAPTQKSALPSNLLSKDEFMNTERPVVQTSTNVHLEPGGLNAAPEVPVSLSVENLPAPNNVPHVVPPPVEPPLNIPNDAEWTLFCAMFTGESGPAKAQKVKQELVKATGKKDFYVVQREVETPVRVPVVGGLMGETKEEIHMLPETDIFYGFYKSIDKTTRDGQAAHADRVFVAGLTDADGLHPLDACIFMQLDPPDPAAPAEWNLVNKDLNKPDSDSTKAYWSIEVAGYRGFKNRKQAAVDAVKAARAMGIEAYYYHGKTTSSVCVGSWPRIAVKEGDAHSDDVHSNPGEILLYTNKPLPTGASPRMHSADGQEIKALTERADIVDQSLMQMLRAYPDHAVNGENITHPVPDVNRRMVMRPEPSFLVAIPRSQVVNSRWSTMADTSGRSAPPPGTANSRSLIESMQMPGTSPDDSTFQGTGAPPNRGLRSVGE